MLDRLLSKMKQFIVVVPLLFLTNFHSLDWERNTNQHAQNGLWFGKRGVNQVSWPILAGLPHIKNLLEYLL